MEAIILVAVVMTFIGIQKYREYRRGRKAAMARVVRYTRRPR